MTRLTPYSHWLFQDNCTLDRMAQAIYRVKPFKTARSLHVLPGDMEAVALSWDEAPAYYQFECRELASQALASLIVQHSGKGGGL